MSDMINNREYRQKILKELISELHNGKTVEEIKPRFEKLIQGISVKEISEMEQALIMDGMPVAEIQKLCDVHAAMFKGSIEEIHQPGNLEQIPGHPIHTLKIENREIESLLSKIKDELGVLQISDRPEERQVLLEDFRMLSQIDKHYSRKENLLFPFMEKYGITAPPKVMWGVDDEIRDAIKTTIKLLDNRSSDKYEIMKMANEAVDKASEMIFKEENILIPMVIETLSEDEWVKIEEGSEEIGYTLIESKEKWKPIGVSTSGETSSQDNQSIASENNGYVNFDAGCMIPEEINAVLNTLPIDITFVDKEGAVKYFTQGKERIFARPKTILGRQVNNCHPPASVHIVEQIVSDFMTGKKDNEDFWLRMGDKFVYIRYFAVKNHKGEYLGTMEVTQDINPIQQITGEKRLLSE